jgi:hypothetical protein
MRRSWTAVAFASLFLSGFARAEEADTLDTHAKMLSPIAYRQLTIIPIVATGEVPDTSKYLTLKEGLAKKLVSVTEMEGGGQVNAVHVANTSSRPLLLLGGEVILGGQQDRIIGNTTILAAGETMTVGVFCVEHGRWSGEGGFNALGGMIDTSTRAKAEFDHNQMGVWDSVAAKTSALAAESDTGTYRTLAAGEQGKKVTTAYTDFFRTALDRLPEKASLVGVVAAVNGRITSVERFASPDLFARYRDSILSAMTLSAVDVPEAAVAAPPKAGDVQAFVEKTRAAGPAARRKAGRAEADTQITEGVARDTVHDSTAPAAAPAIYDSIMLH